MVEDLLNIEINGTPVQARKGAMVIEAADEAGIGIPRFCYHKKLSVAANCRMCLVEVEKAPKPLPACATPVTEGMKVFTRSPTALAAQNSIMEFLLINHPLDCPVCDQGGECELQDLAMGYGQDVSRYSERKRVVKDKYIGPLISTDMTRCIHCTRCVRFGAEIAGLRELGATGRGEFMEIGTFVEKAVSSELSGNIIDLCPVGALNAKPSRMAARAWEMVQQPSVAPHDAIGSNIYLHTLRNRVIRVVPRDCESINESWISDRDRFSYQGLYSDERLTQPMVKQGGSWHVSDWQTALNAVVDALGRYAGAEVGALVAANTTLEELYLLQKWLRGLGVHNIDHRLRQMDFSDQHLAPLFPWLGQTIEDLEQLEVGLLIGSNVRKEQPIASLRLRKAALKGARLMLVNPRHFEFLFDISEKIICPPQDMSDALAGIAAAALAQASAKPPASLTEVLEGTTPTQVQRTIARRLAEAAGASVLLGPIAAAHPSLAVLRALASAIAEHTECTFGYLPEATNSAGAWLAGAVPHRLPAGENDPEPGMNAAQMINTPRKAYVLFGVEPELDCHNPARAAAAVSGAEFVAVFSPFVSETTKDYADVVLPIAPFAETAGTFVNAEGRWQSFAGAVRPLGEARPGWRVLRVLGNLSGLDDFDYMSSEAVRDALKSQFAADQPFDNRLRLNGTLAKPAREDGLMRVSMPHLYATDSLVRRAGALQQTADASPAAVYVSAQQAVELQLADASEVTVEQDGARVRLPLVIDDSVPSGCVWIPAGTVATANLSASFAPVSVQKL